MPHIIQHSNNFFSSRTPKPKLLTTKLEGTGTNPRQRVRPQVGVGCSKDAKFCVLCWVLILKALECNVVIYFN